MTTRHPYYLLQPPSPGATEEFRVCRWPASNSHYAGTDKQGNPALLLWTDTRAEEPKLIPINLRNISISHHDAVELLVEGRTLHHRSMTIFRLTASSKSLTPYFLDICSQLVRRLGEKPSPSQVALAVSYLRDLFRTQASAPLATAQGLWGELVLIESSLNPALLLAGWRRTDDAQFDFSLSDQYIEVKTFSGSTRRHIFSDRQLRPIPAKSVFIVSMRAEQLADGVCIRDLMERVRSRVRNLDELQRLEMQVARLLGSSLSSSYLVPFDYELARTTLRHYLQRAIPRPDFAPNAAIDQVSYRVNLSGLTPALSENLHDAGGLAAASAISPLGA